jgi:hypothetical protein
MPKKEVSKAKCIQQAMSVIEHLLDGTHKLEDPVSNITLKG